MSLCPCGSNKEYQSCCEIIHNDPSKAQTPRELMCSRYSAYVLGKIDHIQKTQTEDQEFDPQEAKRWAQESDWQGLEVRHTSTAGAHGEVEFIARYKNKAGEELAHHEIAHFVKNNNVWFFDHGEFPGGGTYVRETPKVGRNEPCPCGSGKKYKKCCGK